MRRYTLTILLLIAFFAAGGLAIAQMMGDPPVTRGAYVPTLSEDPATAQFQALIFIGGLILTLGAVVGLGIALAVTFTRITALMHTHAGALAEEGGGRSSGPRAQAEKQDLGLPLSSDRSVGIFWLVLVIVVVAFQVLRLWGQPVGYLPGLGELINMPLFRLPGTPIEWLPSFIAGPGNDVTAMHIFIAVLGASVISVLVVGIGMARGVGLLTQTMNRADQLPPTAVDRMIPAVEKRVATMLAPRPAGRRTSGNPIDSFLTGVNVLLVLVILGIIALYVVPSYGSVAAVDQALEATRVAAFATEAPTPGPGGPSPLEALTARLEALPPGSASGGQSAFLSAGCSACHSLDAGVVLVGPSLNNMGAAAATRLPDYSAALYIYESIVNPNAHIAAGFQSGLMPTTFEQVLQPQQIADLVAFLQSQ